MNPRSSRALTGEPWLAVARLATVLALGACGGSSKGSDGADGTSGHNALVAVAVQPPGSQCAWGGSKITAGTDSNDDGALEDSEVSSTQYVCGGPAGASGAVGSAGLSSLMSTAPEPAGASCATGGTRITAGLDLNANGVLEPAEVTSTGYVCQGATGSKSLVAIEAEPAGDHCRSGGSKIIAGTDADANGVLDAAEVASTTYACDGAGLNWVEVTAASAQAASNTGYLARGTAQVVLTLPASPAVGDIVQVSGLGSGGWVLAQNAGQSIRTAGLPGNSAPGEKWTAHDSASSCSAVASSTDGRKLVAIANGQVYTSTDFGLTWTAREAPGYAVASSADGTSLVTVVPGGQIHTSTDSGETWTTRESVRSWIAVASSADGSKLVAAVLNGQIYTSTDSGLTWTPRAVTRQWKSVASSADGSKLVAGATVGGLFTSTDSGLTWTIRVGTRVWNGLASSADGNTLVAATSLQVLTSNDSGQNWIPRGSAGTFWSVASSSDGSKLVAVDVDGAVSTSQDSGLTWTARSGSIGANGGVASSADGTRLVAGGSGQPIYTSLGDRTSEGTAGSLAGSQFEAVSLQYVGDGVFMPLTHESASGAFVVN